MAAQTSTWGKTMRSMKYAQCISIGVLAIAAAFATTASAALVTSIVHVNGTASDVFNSLDDLGTINSTILTKGNDYDFAFALGSALTADSTVTIQAILRQSLDVSFELYQGDPGSGTFLAASDDSVPQAPSLNYTVSAADSPYYIEVSSSDITTSGEHLSGNVYLSAVPEPASWAMMLTGVAGLGAMLRRRSAKVLAA